MDHTPVPKVLLLPHVAVQGGAGLYIQRVVRELSSFADLLIEGDYSDAYAGGARSKLLARVRRPVLPTYHGASLRAFAFHLALAPIRALRWSLRLRATRTRLGKSDTVLGTSSIDLFSVWLMRLVWTDTKAACIIQENVRLTGLRGHLNRHLLRRMDKVISISAAWSARAASFGIDSVIAPNQFDPTPRPSVAPSGELDGSPPYDFLFVGGGARNKGFPFLLKLVAALGGRRPVSVALLGGLDDQQRERVAELGERLSGTGSRVTSFGFVPDAGPFLERSRLLLLPITDPHFCRPAIEAGLRRRTFIVSAFDGLEEFAIDGQNCLMLPSGDLAAWTAGCERLLDDGQAYDRLAAANLRLADRFCSPATFAAALRRAIIA